MINKNHLSSVISCPEMPTWYMYQIGFFFYTFFLHTITRFYLMNNVVYVMYLYCLDYKQCD